jgi:hypothetical protein
MNFRTVENYMEIFKIHLGKFSKYIYRENQNFKKREKRKKKIEF